MLASHTGWFNVKCHKGAHRHIFQRDRANNETIVLRLQALNHYFVSVKRRVEFQRL